MVLLLREKARRLPIWKPLPGPQSIAYNSQADIIGFGGAAGGGKTDLACGKALTQHRKVMMLRREGTQLTGITDRFAELLGSDAGFNSTKGIWRTTRRDGVPLQLEFGSTPHLGDETKYQGRPHDLLVFDEASNFLEHHVRFLLGWLRSTIPGQKCQALLTFNPPTTADGRWIIDFFAPWLDPKFPGKKAQPGEIRYAAMLPDAAGKVRDIWVDRPDAFILVDGVRVYDFDPTQHKPQDIIKPLGRTFIPSRISDNPYLASTGYMSTLQALPEPLRSQMLYGDFQAGIKDDPWQVIPTAWVELAMARWRRPDKLEPMDSMGIDVARGGGDDTTIARRHGAWYDELVVEPGSATPNGHKVAGLAIANQRDGAPMHIDIIGVGASPYDILNQAGLPVYGINVAEGSVAKDKSGRLGFFNLRSETWWKMREDLDPANNTGTALPPDPELLKDLTAPRWSLSGASIKVESRDEIIKRIGRSPDRASAVLLARISTPKMPSKGAASSDNRRTFDPYR